MKPHCVTRSIRPPEGVATGSAKLTRHTSVCPPALVSIKLRPRMVPSCLYSSSNCVLNCTSPIMHAAESQRNDRHQHIFHLGTQTSIILCYSCDQRNVYKAYHLPLFTLRAVQSRYTEVHLRIQSNGTWCQMSSHLVYP